MLLSGTLTLQLSFNTLIYAPAMCRTCFYPPKATEICCHLQDLLCSTCLKWEAMNHSFSVLQLILHLFLYSAPTHSDCQFSMLGFWGFEAVGLARQRQGLWSRVPSLRRSHRSAAKRPLDVAQNCFTYWDKWWNYQSQRCKDIKYTLPTKGGSHQEHSLYGYAYLGL